MERAVSSPYATILFLLKRVDCNDGVASYCQTLVEGLSARGDEAYIYSGSVTQYYGSATRYERIRRCVRDWAVDEAMEAARPSGKLINHLVRTVKQWRISVISPQGLSQLPLAMIVSFLTGVPVVANYHPSLLTSNIKTQEKRFSWQSKLLYWVLTHIFQPRKFIAISKEIGDFYINDCHISPKRIAYITNGIDTKFFHPPTASQRAQARNILGLADDWIVCVLAARLNFVKGHDVVIDALRLLRSQNVNANFICLFVGSGDQADEIKSYAFNDENDAHAFRFLGFMPDQDFRDVFWASDIALLPSRHEGFALVIAEAMACGCIPIRTRTGGATQQIIEGETGFTIPFNDAPALADRLRTLIDPGLREKLRLRASIHARHEFSQDEMVKKTSELYRAMAPWRD
ncbi:glycosyltransferase family 4 protein [Beijerinckia mobilis]|uniref:glycosyltransferase family 4 protein n=1 Tax=Beijerinckia mobilis TaxID=231434 RepID=UPI0009FE61F4|nr:glycosyltransferase family 4 protein [Beijerinckia mobilis]